MSTDYLLRAECFIFWNRHYGMTGLLSEMSQVEEIMRLKTGKKATVISSISIYHKDFIMKASIPSHSNSNAAMFNRIHMLTTPCLYENLFQCIACSLLYHLPIIVREG